MITRTRFLFPSKDSDDFGTKPKHQLQAMVFYFHMCSAHCSRRKETADSGQDGALTEECSTCWELFVHVWKLLSNTLFGELFFSSG